METPQPFVTVNRDVLRVALPEEPREVWAYRVEWIGSEPFFTHLEYSAAEPDRTTVRRRAATFHPPVARLVGIWCLHFGKNLDGTDNHEHCNLWDGVMSGRVAGFTRAPDPRPLGGTGTDEYAEAMHRWTEPIADTLELAATVGLSDVKAVQLRFGVKRDVAKKRAAAARQWNRRLNPDLSSLRASAGRVSEENYGTHPETWEPGPVDPRTPEWGGPPRSSRSPKTS